ncbi:hypothetical protein ACFPL7_02325 [Dongia soli]|uniref:Uncharacterized protein n=1 Tax=Dongia soli TaxID=600628 RepID=A0ABU5EG93_9PROT|nr:hypothetical protein [Dongia soli]MDY0885236.1 hypothetical protein [Dongia soli]
MTGADEMAVMEGPKSENGKNHHHNLTKAEYETLAAGQKAARPHVHHASRGTATAGTAAGAIAHALRVITMRGIQDAQTGAEITMILYLRSAVAAVCSLTRRESRAAVKIGGEIANFMLLL